MNNIYIYIYSKKKKFRESDVTSATKWSRLQLSPISEQYIFQKYAVQQLNNGCLSPLWFLLKYLFLTEKSRVFRFFQVSVSCSIEDG